MRGLMIGAAAGLVFVAGAGRGLLGRLPRSRPPRPRSRTWRGPTSAIRIWGAPAAISVYALTGWLIGMERTRGVLVLQLATNGINVVL